MLAIVNKSLGGDDDWRPAVRRSTGRLVRRLAAQHPGAMVERVGVDRPLPGSDRTAADRVCLGDTGGSGFSRVRIGGSERAGVTYGAENQPERRNRPDIRYDPVVHNRSDSSVTAGRAYDADTDSG
jgi:hypothetical protein